MSLKRRMQRKQDSDLRDLIHETYAIHYLFRNLGIDSDHIFVGVPFVANRNPPGPCAAVQARQGSLEFLYTLRPTPDTDLYLNRWTAFVNLLPQANHHDLDVIVHNSEVWKTKSAILVAMTMKGFVLPGTDVN